MKQASLIKKYDQLEDCQKNFLQVLAVAEKPMGRTEVANILGRFGFVDDAGRKLRFNKAFKPKIQELIDLDLARFETTSCVGPIDINPLILDFAVQESMMVDHLEFYISQTTEELQSYQFWRLAPAVMKRSLRHAFYQGDLELWLELSEFCEHSFPKLLSPFRQHVFDQLSPAFQEIQIMSVMIRAFIAPNQVENAADGRRLISQADVFSLRDSHSQHEFISTRLSILVAQGNLEQLRDFGKKHEAFRAETHGCLAFLEGRFQEATAHFDQALKQTRKLLKKRKVCLGFFSAFFQGILLLKENNALSRKRLSSHLDLCGNCRPEHRKWTLPLSNTLGFLSQPTNQEKRQQMMSPSFCDTSIGLLFVGWTWQWFLPEEEPPFVLEKLTRSADRYRDLELNWVAGELDAIAAHLANKVESKELTKRHKQTHESLGTQSLSTFIQPVPLWIKTLDAIENIAGTVEEKSSTASDSHGLHSERMIWELDYSNTALAVSPIVQKATKKGWSRGRRVALSRLYNDQANNEFSFLTDQDRSLCRCIREYSERNYRGYRETSYGFKQKALAKALFGHPQIFSPEDRTNPLDIQAGLPQLLVSRAGQKTKMIVVPEPQEGALLIQSEGSHCISIFEFSKEQRDLAKLLTQIDSIPKEHEDRVAQVASSLSRIIGVQSEIGGGTSQRNSTKSNHAVDIQITPYHEGLRATLVVRPLGEGGPVFRPGVGASNVLAVVDGKQLTTTRDLVKERKSMDVVLENCTSLREHPTGGLDQEWIFEDRNSALDLALELQALTAKKKIQVLWPRGRSHDVAGEATVSQFKVSVKRAQDWFVASGHLKIDSQLKLDMARLVELIADSPGRFLQLDDGRFLALTNQLRQRVAELTAFSQTVKGKIQFPALRALAMEGFVEDTGAKTDSHWKSYVKKIREAEKIDCTAPTTLQTELRDYQADGLAWLKRLAHWSGGACLADDMGLGKTIQALALLIDRANDGPALVVAPASVGFNWESETRRFAPTLQPKIFGDSDREKFFEQLSARDLVITTYGLLQSESDRFAKVSWQTVILDEAQAIKNMATKRSQSAMQLKANFRLVMTGTPVENHLGELWNLFHFIAPGLLGTHNDFRSRFAVPIERDQCRETKNRLKQLIRPFLLRRTKSQVLDELPGRTEVTLSIEPSVQEVAFYDALRQQALKNLSDNTDANDKKKKGERHLRVLAEITKLRMACCHPQLVGGDMKGAKLEVFQDKIQELVEGQHKVLVFSQFVKHLAILRQALDDMKIDFQYLDGSTPTKKRKEIVESFQGGKGDVFLISLKAGGTGLNLTAADYVIHMDPWWNPAVEDQATDRAHRIGQTRPVNVYRFITKGTIEEQILKLHASKRDLADSLLDGSNKSAKLSTDDLLELLRS